MQAFDGGFEFRSLRHDIEAAFGRDLFALFRNEADFIRHDAQGNIDNLRRVAHFEIQLRHDVFAQPLDVAILNVATVGPQMGDDALRTGALTNRGRRHGIGLGVF